jgi:hypothetical protein
MNRHTLLHLLRAGANAGHEFYAESLAGLPDSRDIDAIAAGLALLNGGNAVAMPETLPDDETECLEALLLHFQGRVTFVSLWMSLRFPAQYLFYRSSVLDDAIATGLSQIEGSDVSPVAPTDWEQYEGLNQWLWWMGEILWPELEDPRSRLLWLLYDGLGMLFHEPHGEGSAWLCSGPPEEQGPEGSPEHTVWPAHPEMNPNDLVFMYRTTPVNSLTDVFKVYGAPWFNPWGEWHGFWANLEPVGPLPRVSLARMKAGAALRQWDAVREDFGGDATRRVPPEIYRELIDMIEPEVRRDLELPAEASDTLE